MRVSRVTADSRTAARSESRSAISASIFVREEALMTTGETVNAGWAGQPDGQVGRYSYPPTGRTWPTRLNLALQIHDEGGAAIEPARFFA